MSQIPPSCPMSLSALSQVTPSRPNSPYNVAFGKLIEKTANLMIYEL